ncbi:glycosyltransferase family 4 protein [Neolewinella lacunae]|uniref:Glycosyltransferase family 4 protein n=1 Tax=Neolewinella lacunae TaxID=1517758 RepID=A0A923PJR8_9BACT|nr:glycosyltransferase family 4 protein [Neolewinella lacunae]MBC6995357.1 glycosyltransferase family 4 protein [Neolewinella lacunae]MDN3633069.1 glycosyltransferase family 4 protein [Neolewinella lacunae]
MKIVCTVTNDLSHEQRMDRVCTSLVKAGHEVTLVGRLRVGSRELPEKPYRQYRISCRYNHGKRFYAAYNYQLWRTLRHWDFDALCAVDLDTLPAGVALTNGRRKLIFDAHEWFSETPEVVGRPLVRGVWRGLGKALVPRTDLRYTVAPVLAEKLGAEYGVPFGTVRNLPLRSHREPAPVPAQKIILYQGMLNPGRGLEVAIAAMQWLPDCELWLVGKGPEEGALRRCQERLEEPGKVRFLGFRPPEELPDLTRKAWLGLNLLDAVSPSYYYSLANKALDYVQAGLPSVQMDFPEYRALQNQHHCYLLLDQLDARALAQRIATLANDPAAYEQLRANCLRAAEVLCWEREEEVLLGLWADLAPG